MQSSYGGNSTLINSHGVNLTLNSYGINFLNVPKQVDANAR